MQDMERIRTAHDRNVRAVERRPRIAKGVASTQVRSLDGTTCEVREGDWRMTVDMPEAIGGNERGPTPGVLGRGALGSCLAISCMIWASKMGVPIEALDVRVDAESDSRGEFGMDDSVPPGYTALRVTLEIVSPAPRDRVEAAVAAAERYSCYNDIFRRPVDLHCDFRVRHAAAES